MLEIEPGDIELDLVLFDCRIIISVDFIGSNGYSYTYSYKDQNTEYNASGEYYSGLPNTSSQSSTEILSVIFSDIRKDVLNGRTMYRKD